MFRRAGIERVCRESALAAQKSEIRLRHDQVQITRLAAHRAVAVDELDLRSGPHLEADDAAVAAALLPTLGGFGAHTQDR